MNLLLLTLFSAFAVNSLNALEIPLPLPNIAYGSDPAQVLDLYIPTQIDGNSTKVILLVHGGAWGGGQKLEMERFIPPLQRGLPTHIIANMEYRLGTHASPGFPKQLEDIHLAIRFLKGYFPSQNVTFGLMGGSAGAHLSMLYSYAWDSSVGLRNVKVIADVVGPSDITHPSYSQNPLYTNLFLDLVGGCVYSACPEIYNASSPVIWVSGEVPPTIGFYGNADILVPNSQMPIIQEALERFGVTHRFTVYPGGHANWADEYQIDMMEQIMEFFTENW